MSLCWNAFSMVVKLAYEKNPFCFWIMLSHDLHRQSSCQRQHVDAVSSTLSATDFAQTPASDPNGFIGRRERRNAVPNIGYFSLKHPTSCRVTKPATFFDAGHGVVLVSPPIFKNRITYEHRELPDETRPPRLNRQPPSSRSSSHCSQSPPYVRRWPQNISRNIGS